MAVRRVRAAVGSQSTAAKLIMKIWMLSQHYICPESNSPRPICWAYSNGHVCPENAADIENGWALVRCNSDAHQIDAAGQDPRVRVFRTLWDVITPETVTAYQSKGAVAGMMLGQLIQILAQSDPGYAGD